MARLGVKKSTIDFDGIRIDSARHALTRVGRGSLAQPWSARPCRLAFARRPRDLVQGCHCGGQKTIIKREENGKGSSRLDAHEFRVRATVGVAGWGAPVESVEAIPNVELCGIGSKRLMTQTTK